MGEWELSSFHKKAYGRYGRAPDPCRCAGGVSQGAWFPDVQCSRKRGHGPEQAFCKQHDPVAKKARDDARNAKWDRESAINHNARALSGSAPMFLDTLRKIADGHNDPREIAREAITSCEAKLKPVPEK